jgi:uncharacterized protein involved in exopolysaccharide biosynthesis
MLRALSRLKWLIAIPVVVMVAATMAWSRYYLPERYRSEAVILVVPPRTPLPVAGVSESLSQRLTTISQQVLSRTRLERIIDEFHVYGGDDQSEPIEKVLTRFRSETSFAIRRDAESGISGFTISFVSAKPDVAMKVTDRLASMIITENLQDTELLSYSAVQFVKGRIAEVRRNLDLSESMIEARRKKGIEPTRSEAIEYEVQQESLRALLVREQELANALSAARRQIGEQFKLIEGARLPKNPIGPNRTAVNVAGGAVGLGVGLLLAWVRRSRDR